MKVSAVQALVSEVLQDVSMVTWTSAQLIAWLNDAQRTIALVRPEVSTVTAAVKLAAGTRQSIPAAGIKLLDVTRNMGSAGTTPRKAIRLVDRAAKDAASPDWHREHASPSVREYAVDRRTERDFWVSPPVTSYSDVYVEITYTVAPTAVTLTTDDISVDEIYSPAMVEWMLYRAFSRDSESTPNAARAAAHMERFYVLMGIRAQKGAEVSPTTGGRQ